MGENLEQLPNNLEKQKVSISLGGITTESFRISDQEKCAVPPTSLSTSVCIVPPKKSSSFQITSITIGSRSSNDGGDDSADDLDESHTDDMSDVVDNSRITDIENETPSFSEDTFSKEDVFFNPSSTSVSGATLIPTSSQYGLAVVGSTESLTSTSNAPSTTVTANTVGSTDVRVTATETTRPSVINVPSSTKTTEPQTKVQTHPPRNDRFKVVKIESTEPFKRGRWTCMDYLDHSATHHSVMNIRSTEVMESIMSGTVHYVVADMNSKYKGGENDPSKILRSPISVDYQAIAAMLGQQKTRTAVSTCQTTTATYCQMSSAPQVTQRLQTPTTQQPIFQPQVVQQPRPAAVQIVNQQFQQQQQQQQQAVYTGHQNVQLPQQVIPNVPQQQMAHVISARPILQQQNFQHQKQQNLQQQNLQQNLQQQNLQSNLQQQNLQQQNLQQQQVHSNLATQQNYIPQQRQQVAQTVLVQQPVMQQNIMLQQQMSQSRQVSQQVIHQQLPQQQIGLQQQFSQQQHQLQQQVLQQHHIPTQQPVQVQYYVQQPNVSGFVTQSSGNVQLLQAAQVAVSSYTVASSTPLYSPQTYASTIPVSVYQMAGNVGIGMQVTTQKPLPQQVLQRPQQQNVQQSRPKAPQVHQQQAIPQPRMQTHVVNPPHTMQPQQQQHLQPQQQQHLQPQQQQHLQPQQQQHLQPQQQQPHLQPQQQQHLQPQQQHLQPQQQQHLQPQQQQQQHLQPQQQQHLQPQQQQHMQPQQQQHLQPTQQQHMQPPQQHLQQLQQQQLQQQLQPLQHLQPQQNLQQHMQPQQQRQLQPQQQNLQPQQQNLQPQQQNLQQQRIPAPMHNQVHSASVMGIQQQVSVQGQMQMRPVMSTPVMNTGQPVHQSAVSQPVGLTQQRPTSVGTMVQNQTVVGHQQQVASMVAVAQGSYVRQQGIQVLTQQPQAQVQTTYVMQQQQQHHQVMSPQYQPMPPQSSGQVQRQGITTGQQYVHVSAATSAIITVAGAAAQTYAVAASTCAVPTHTATRPVQVAVAHKTTVPEPAPSVPQSNREQPTKSASSLPNNSSSDEVQPAVAVSDDVERYKQQAKVSTSAQKGGQVVANSTRPKVASVPASASGTNAVAIDNKIEQAMDLVKSHLMFAVREEVEVLKEKIAELMERISQLELENSILKAGATQETLAQLCNNPVQPGTKVQTQTHISSGNV